MSWERIVKSPHRWWIPAILIFSVSCGLLPNAPRDASPGASLAPKPPQTLIAAALPEPSLTPEPLPTPSQTASFEVVPTPAYSIRSELLIDECYPPKPGDDPIPGKFEPCSGFTVSQDERYLGYYFGPESCGRGIHILEIETGDPTYSTEFGGLKFEFLANGKVMVTTGHCEGGRVDLLDPESDKLTSLGGLGIGEANNLWNNTGSALAVNTNPYHGFESAIWGYNVTEDFIFLAQPDEWQVDDDPIWVPGGTHLLYTHQEMSQVGDMETFDFPTGKQIIRVDATNGEQFVLATDPNFGYYFCPGYTLDCTSKWYGDWIQILRFPFEPQQWTFSPWTTEETECLFYGINCEIPPVLFALNWRTGEMTPWDERGLPTPIPRPTATWSAEFG